MHEQRDVAEAVRRPVNRLEWHILYLVRRRGMRDRRGCGLQRPYCDSVLAGENSAAHKRALKRNFEFATTLLVGLDESSGNLAVPFGQDRRRLHGSHQ